MTRQHQILALEPGCGTAAVKHRWRELASQHHPDKGGTSVAFALHNGARKVVMDYEAELESFCKECDGHGTVTTMVGFKSQKKVCQECRGSGKTTRKQ